MEFGEPSYLSFVGTKAGLDLILRLGPERIERQVLALSQRLYDGLMGLGVEIISPSEKGLRSGIVSFSTPSTEKHYKQLMDTGFLVSLRPAGIRVSTGFYNTKDEVDRLLEKLGTLL